jgi:hypothetical protein
MENCAEGSWALVITAKSTPLSVNRFMRASSFVDPRRRPAAFHVNSCNSAPLGPSNDLTSVLGSLCCG